MVDVQVNKLNRPIYWVLADVGFRKSGFLNSERYIHQENSMDFFKVFHMCHFPRLQGRGTKKHPPQNQSTPLNHESRTRLFSSTEYFLDWGLFSLIIRRLLEQRATSNWIDLWNRNRFSVCGWHIEVKNITHIYHISYIRWDSHDPPYKHFHQFDNITTWVASSTWCHFIRNGRNSLTFRPISRLLLVVLWDFQGSRNFS